MTSDFTTTSTRIRRVPSIQAAMSQEMSQKAAGARPVSNPPPHLICSSCSKPLFNCFQTSHGCRLCQPCVTNLLPATERRRCPGNTESCRDEHEEIDVSQATCFADMATRRELARLQVHCPNCDAGCCVTLAWGQVDSHVGSCPFQKLNCDLCHQEVMKSSIQHHVTNECLMRKIKCDKCSQSVPFTDMDSKHRNLQSDVCCQAFSDHCPHCGDRSRRLDRRGYMAHLSVCPESPVDCKYCHLGCSVRLRRSDIQEHYRTCTDSHLELVEARLKQVPTAQPQSQSAAAAGPAGDGSDVADVKRRVGSVFEQFKKLQVNVANWAHSTIEMEQMAERFGGIPQLRTLLTRLDDRTRGFEQMQQQMQQMQQQLQQLQQQMQRTPTP